MHRIAWHALARSSHAGRSQRRAGLVAPRVSILVIGTIEFARAPHSIRNQPTNISELST